MCGDKSSTGLVLCIVICSSFLVCVIVALWSSINLYCLPLHCSRVQPCGPIACLKCICYTAAEIIRKCFVIFFETNQEATSSCFGANNISKLSIVYEVIND